MNNSILKERASHPSRAQIENLLEFFAENPHLAKGFPKMPCAKDTARKLWAKLTLELNNIEGCTKSWRQWTKYWADKKNSIKKKLTSKSSGGEIELSEIEEKILLLMCGDSSANGKMHLEAASDTAIIKTEKDNSFTKVTESPVRELVSPSSLHTATTSRSDSPDLPSTPSESGIHPPQETRYVLLRSSTQDHPSSPITTKSNRLNKKRRRMSSQSQRQSQFARLTEQFLRLEEQRIEVDRRNSLLFEKIVNREMERDDNTARAMLAIGEGLKLLAEAIKSKCGSSSSLLADF